jgi:hypothetical protein
MAISEPERVLMLQVPSIGPKMIGHLERIGIRRLADLKGMDPEEIAFRINSELGIRRINKTRISALAGLVHAADRANR